MKRDCTIASGESTCNAAVSLGRAYPQSLPNSSEGSISSASTSLRMVPIWGFLVSPRSILPTLSGCIPALLPSSWRVHKRCSLSNLSFSPSNFIGVVVGNSAPPMTRLFQDSYNIVQLRHGISRSFLNSALSLSPVCCIIQYRHDSYFVVGEEKEHREAAVNPPTQGKLHHRRNRGGCYHTPVRAGTAASFREDLRGGFAVAEYRGTEGGTHYSHSPIGSLSVDGPCAYRPILATKFCSVAATL